MSAEIIADYHNECGECPLWHPQEKKFYWCDIPAGRLFRYDPVAGDPECVWAGEIFGGFTFQADGSLLMFMDRGAVRIWREGKLETVIDSLPEEQNARFNDVIADPEGRVFCGTMSSAGKTGRLYRLDLDGSITKLLDGIGCSNGMGFTPDCQEMYYTDSRQGEIYRFDYERSTGEISNQRVFLSFPREEGLHDGLTVDADGNIWSAFYNGGCVRCFDPQGKELRRFDLPAALQTTAPAFGGEAYDQLYVTSAGGHEKETAGANAGALFRLRPGARGVPEFSSRVGL